jgi:5-methyltetrahydropteroyltriglutamate--homocysteine methyltransferase
MGTCRELKSAVECFWSGKLDAEALRSVGRDLRKEHWNVQKQTALTLVPTGDFSFYDQVLDTSLMVGNVPERFLEAADLDGFTHQFLMARGQRQASCCQSHGGAASEMTKWFDTNYHYIVPEFQRHSTFALNSRKLLDETAEAMALGMDVKPVLIGPLTYLQLGKVHDQSADDFDRFTLLNRLLPVYETVLGELAALGVKWVQIDEPILVTDLSADVQSHYLPVYRRLRAAAPGLKLMLATYFGGLEENAALALNLPVDALHLDLCRAPEQLQSILALGVPAHMELSLGVVDGRNIWRNVYQQSLRLIERAVKALGPSRVWLAPSCSLLHVPHSLVHETALDEEIKGWLAFATEKLDEVHTLAILGGGHTPFAPSLRENEELHSVRRHSSRVRREEVQARLATITPANYERGSPFSVRQQKQRDRFQLPSFPTTTIGSFPQTPEIRTTRAQWKKGTLSTAEYERRMEQEIAHCVRAQEEIGLDVPVHGEAERNDMVEYFGEQLEGFIFTRNGWVQSYGSRCVKPPIIYGDVTRPKPMTVRWSKYAQSLTTRPMKAMLTGPVTILQWSFVRDDQPRATTMRQIALALRDEVLDLEYAGLGIIQIDEPALREGLPLRQKNRAHYLRWAVDAFRLSASAVRDETQIHTHMCYCEFNDIIDSIAALDADVITIETSRSAMELLEAFVEFHYPNEIGPGVYDIHSPRIPTVKDMMQLLQKAAAVLPAENLWVNPDCGLKTRRWEEVTPALRNMVAAARQMRERVVVATA